MLDMCLWHFRLQESEARRDASHHGDDKHLKLRQGCESCWLQIISVNVNLTSRSDHSSCWWETFKDPSQSLNVQRGSPNAGSDTCSTAAMGAPVLDAMAM